MTTMQDRAAILVTERIGRTQSLTPEGFLLCTDVRIARIGEMNYLPREVPEIAPGAMGRVVLTRDADTLFDPMTIASFAGKPVTNDHPPQFVSPESYKRFTVGTVLEPRRGENLDDGYLVADLLIMDAKTIRDVQNGKREVSCGYDCERVEIKPGLGRQTKIVGNHVALVLQGRAGPACAINDKEPNMPQTRTMIQRIRAAFSAQNRDALEEELDVLKDEDSPEEEKKETEDSASPALIAAIASAVSAGMKPIADSLAAIQKSLKDSDGEEEKKTEDEDEEKEETMDAAAFKEAWLDTVARAEILAPGIRVPTADAASGSSAIADLQRSALSQAFVTPKTTAHVVTVLGPNPNFQKLTNDAAQVAFHAASEIAKAANNAPKPTAPNFFPEEGKMTAAKVQELNAARRTKL